MQRYNSKIEKITIDEVEYELYPYNLKFLLDLENGKNYNLLEAIEKNSNIPKDIIEKLDLTVAKNILNKIEEMSKEENTKEEDSKKK